MNLMLAPMVDLTHPAFRELVAYYGGCSLFFTEMVNVRYIAYNNPLKDPYLVPAKRDRPLVVQLVGREMEEFRIAISKLEGLDYISGYNLNLGCTKGKFQKFGWGASLLKEPDVVKEILKVMVEASSLPVSVKMRTPPEHDLDGLLLFLRIFEECGVDFVVLHPRSPEDGFRRKARWEEIAFAVKRSSLKIVANGDVFSPEDVKGLMDMGVHGVMVGRAALIRPWFFRNVCDPDFEPPVHEPIELVSKYITKYLPKNWWEKRFLSFCYWYFQNFSEALYLLRRLNRAKGFNGKVEEALKVVEGLRPRKYPVYPFLSPC